MACQPMTRPTFVPWPNAMKRWQAKTAELPNASLSLLLAKERRSFTSISSATLQKKSRVVLRLGSPPSITTARAIPMSISSHWNKTNPAPEEKDGPAKSSDFPAKGRWNGCAKNGPKRITASWPERDHRLITVLLKIRGKAISSPHSMKGQPPGSCRRKASVLAASPRPEETAKP